VHAQEEEIIAPEIWKGSPEESRERYAAAKAWNAQVWPRRQRWQGEEPQAGDRHRIVRGTQKGREGTAKEGGLTNRILLVKRCRHGDGTALAGVCPHGFISGNLFKQSLPEVVDPHNLGFSLASNTNTRQE
jgi:hypothetical protein